MEYLHWCNHRVLLETIPTVVQWHTECYIIQVLHVKRLIYPFHSRDFDLIKQLKHRYD